MDIYLLLFSNKQTWTINESFSVPLGPGFTGFWGALLVSLPTFPLGSLWVQEGRYKVSQDLLSSMPNNPNALCEY